MDKSNRLFVYGSLAPGESNHHIVEEIDGVWMPAYVKGHLSEQGWGAHIGFPGITLDQQGEAVNGQVFISEELPNHWERLDAFEGDEYQRVLAEVLFNQSKVEAYVYELKRGCLKVN